MARNIDIVVSEDPSALVAEKLAAAARAGGHIVVTGGNSVADAYRQAAALEPDWSNVDVWFTDERCVPQDDDRSNAKLVRDSLNVQGARIHRIRGELGKEQGATLYEQELTPVERFDFVLLGLGPDGHIASLFPLQPTLDVTERKAIGAEAHLEPFVDRITLTLPMLRGAREIVFLVTGEKKADAMRRAFGEPPDPASPAGRVRPAGELIVLCDSAAAGGLAR
jgi:6-phosphogluconolactonase